MASMMQRNSLNHYYKCLVGIVYLVFSSDVGSWSAQGCALVE